MSTRSSVNIYARLLGIPGELTSPNYYQLLGIDEYTDDPQIIREASTECNRKLQRLQNSEEHYRAVKQLEAEVALAYRTLMDPERRRQYDLQLREAEPTQESSEESVQASDPPDLGEVPGNPYALLLGLPEDVSAPNHYQLLNVKPFTDDINAIYSAGISQTQRLVDAASETGFHRAASALRQRVNTAVRTLADEKQKAEYDEALRGEGVAEEPAEDMVANVAIAEPSEFPAQPAPEEKTAKWHLRWVDVVAMIFIFLLSVFLLLVAASTKVGFEMTVFIGSMVLLGWAGLYFFTS